MTHTETDLSRQTTSDEIIAIERTFETKDTGFVSTVTVRTVGEEGAVFRLFDRVPEDVTVTEAGFRPGSEPMEGTADETGVAIEGIVRPGEEERFEYGFTLADPANVDLFGVPVIEKSIRIDAEDADEAEDIPIVRGAAVESESQPSGARSERKPASPSGGIFGQVRKTLLGDNPTNGDDDESQKPIRGMEFGSTESNETQDGDPIESTGPAETAGEGAESTSLNSLFSSVEETDSSPSNTGTDEESLVAALTKEIQQGEVTTEEIETLREELRLHRSESTDVRLSYLQSRVDRFAAYTEALEELIDKHGTGTEIVDGLLKRISDLREDVLALSAEVEEARHHRSDNQNRLTELESRSDGIESDVEHLRRDLDEQDKHHAQTIDDLSERIEGFREELAADIERKDDELTRLRRDLVDDLETHRSTTRSEIDDLRDEVAQNSQIRQKLIEIAAVAGGRHDDDSGDVLRSQLSDASEDADQSDPGASTSANSAEDDPTS